MKTKTFKIICSLIMVQLISNPLHSQYVYFHLGGGYSMATGKQSMPDFFNCTETPDSKHVEQIRFSYGQGLNLQGSLGYMINDYLGAEIGINYLNCDNWRSKETYTDTLVSYTTAQNRKATMVRINPNVVFQAEPAIVTPYCKMGILLGFGSISQEKYRNKSQTIEETWELSGGMAIGFNTILGANIEIDDNMYVFTELAVTSMNYSPTKGNLNRYLVNGADKLYTLNKNTTEIEFVDNYDEIPAPTSSSPSQVFKQSHPFSNVGLNIGFRWTFK
jgi:hypothetical protein